MIKSPYESVAINKWLEITNNLIKEHPLNTKEIVDVVLVSWDAIFKSQFGKKGFKIGIDIFPKPQIMGFLLHELIPLELSARYPEIWRHEISAGDKDIVHIPNEKYSIEIKTSSNPRHIYGNRSYAQGTVTNKKSKSGYYLAVNFQKFQKTVTNPQIVLIRFGWLDFTDWIGQRAASGQQARLSPEVEYNKLHIIYSI